jgi:hypothetical protein
MRIWKYLTMLLVTMALVVIPFNPVYGDAFLAVQGDQAMESTIIKNKPYAQIRADSHTLINNIWGAPKYEAVDSGVYMNSDGTFGWYWDRPSPEIGSGAKCVLPIYPSIRIGGNRWERTRITPFPLRLGDVESFTFDIGYTYLTGPTGSNDLSYDMFLSSPDQPNSCPAINAEVMIWLDGNQGQPKKHYKGDFSDGNNTFALYSWVMADGRTYYSFILIKDSFSEGSYNIDARKLLGQLGLESGLLMHGIEFGNEIWSGSGKIEIQKFSVNINGKEI